MAIGRTVKTLKPSNLYGLTCVLAYMGFDRDERKFHSNLEGYLTSQSIH